MTEKKRPHESEDKGGGSVKPAPEGASPMQRFKKLARGVLGVSRDQVEKARKEFSERPKKGR